MNRLNLAILLTTSSLALVGTSWGQAVSVDASSLVRRLDAIEARLSSSERRTGGNTAAGGALAGGNSYTAADLERRMDELENDSSQLHGSNDRALQAIERLAKRFDDYAKDFDMRLGDIEARLDELGKTPAVAATPAAEATPAVAPAANPSGPPLPAKPANPVPADLSASDHYNKAYAYLTATDYKNAQLWFEEFLKRHPQDALADNAYYWLGEVYLVQNNPSAAVGKFRDGLKAFPKGGKVTANLFKMGVALEQLKQPKLARAAWEKLLKDYPTAPEAARAKDKLLQVKG